MKRAAWLVVLGFALFFTALAAAQPAADEGLAPLGTELPHGEHAEAQGDAHGGHHVPSFGDINWWHGFVGEKDGVEPGLLWRPTGMPAPLGATLLNTAILVFLLVRFAKKPLSDALKKRKAGIMTGMEEAGKMKDDAKARLEGYEDKLAHIDDEIERVKREMRKAGEAERKRILSDAKEKREQMERDARLLIEQELKASQEMLMRETVRAAVQSAEERLGKALTPQDQERLADEYLASLDDVKVSSLGGKA